MSEHIKMVVLSVRSEYAGRPIWLETGISPHEIETAKFDVLQANYEYLCWRLEKTIERLREGQP